MRCRRIMRPIAPSSLSRFSTGSTQSERATIIARVLESVKYAKAENDGIAQLAPHLSLTQVRKLRDRFDWVDYHERKKATPALLGQLARSNEFDEAWAGAEAEEDKSASLAGEILIAIAPFAPPNTSSACGSCYNALTSIM